MSDGYIGPWKTIKEEETNGCDNAQCDCKNCTCDPCECTPDDPCKCAKE